MPRVPLGAVAPSPGVPLGTQTRHLAVTHLAWWDRVLADFDFFCDDDDICGRCEEHVDDCECDVDDDEDEGGEA